MKVLVFNGESAIILIQLKINEFIRLIQKLLTFNFYLTKTQRNESGTDSPDNVTVVQESFLS